MPDRQPAEPRNLNRYEGPALPWARAHDLLSPVRGVHSGFFLGTVSPDGRPHAAGVGAVWHDDDLYFTSGPGTRKSRDLASNPPCTIAVTLPGDLTLEAHGSALLDSRLGGAMAHFDVRGALHVDPSVPQDAAADRAPPTTAG